jgi:transcriptional regulator with XRE-family HTH domain
MDSPATTLDDPANDAPDLALGALQNVGSLPRRERHKRRLTLVQVAERADISPAFLSLVERRKATPSLGSFAAIADVLGLPITAFVKVGLPADAATREGARLRCSVRDSSLTYERLSTVFPGQHFDAVAIQVPERHQGETIAHPGAEWVYVLAGGLQLLLDGTPIDLKAGDTCHFPGDTVHSYVNPGRAAATVAGALGILTLEG